MVGLGLGRREDFARSKSGAWGEDEEKAPGPTNGDSGIKEQGGKRGRELWEEGCAPTDTPPPTRRRAPCRSRSGPRRR